MSWHAFRAWLVALDQLVCSTLVLPFALIGLSEAPVPQETVSSLVGRMALRGYAWALYVEPFLNAFFEFLGDGPDHCRRSIIPQFQT